MHLAKERFAMNEIVIFEGKCSSCVFDGMFDLVPFVGMDGSTDPVARCPICGKIQDEEDGP